jgi:uncharacterized protein involved in exopolysaccharide biosynthesis
MAQEIPGDNRVRRGSLVQDGSIDTHTLSRILRAEAFTFIAVVFVCVALSVVYLHAATPKYAVRMEITSTSSSDQARGTGISALASIAGINASGESPQFRLFVGSLRSPIAAEAIVSNQALLKAIFYREWSESEGKWREPPSVVRPIRRAIGNLLGWKFATWAPPGVSRVYDYLNAELKIIPDAKSGVVTLEIDSDRTDVAESVLLALNTAMNERLREHDLEHSTTYISYLSKRLSEINVVEYRTALITNLAQEEKTRMQASSPLPYASDILGKPMISSKPVAPVPLAAWGAGFVLGGVLGLWLASLKYRRR